MIAYVYWKSSFGINCIINNVTSISDNQIIGDSTIVFGGGSDYIVLQDSIDKNIGDIIDISNLIDERTYFTKGKDAWLIEKISNVNSRVETLETEPPLPTRTTENEVDISTNNDTLSYLLTDIIPSLQK
jgi:hypothetical protein